MRAPAFCIFFALLVLQWGALTALSQVLTAEQETTLVLKWAVTEVGKENGATFSYALYCSEKKWRLENTDNAGVLVYLATFDGEKIYQYRSLEAKLLISRPGKLSAYGQHYRLMCHFMGPFLPLMTQPTEYYKEIPFYPLPGEVFGMADKARTMESLNTPPEMRLNLGEQFHVYTPPDLSNALLETNADGQGKAGALSMVKDASGRCSSLSRHDESGRLLYEMEFTNYREFPALAFPLPCVTDIKVYFTEPHEKVQVLRSIIEEVGLSPGDGVEYSIPQKMAVHVVDESE